MCVKYFVSFLNFSKHFSQYFCCWGYPWMCHGRGSRRQVNSNVLTDNDDISISRCGRRLAVILSCVPLILGWLVTLLASSLTHLYLARAVTGLGIGLITPITTLYLREISIPRLRGHLFIINCLLWNGGTFLMFILGSLLPWKLATIPGFSFPLVPILLAWTLPESPTWLVSR